MQQPLSQSIQVIENELEAQNEDNNLVEIDLSLEAQAVLAYSHRVYNRDKILAKLKRANPHITKQKHKKSSLLCSQAQKLFKTVMHKLQTQERVLLNSKYISKITGCDSTDQNKRIMGQLDNLLAINYHRLAIVDGTPYNYHYSFELKPEIIEELKAAGLWNLKSMPALMRLSYNNIPNTSNRSIRSRANFSNAENSNSETSNTELEENKKSVAKGKSDISLANQPTNEPVETTQEAQTVEESHPKAAPVEQLQVKATRPSNKRKTKTCEQQKQRKAANVVRNGFLAGGKRLSEIQPYLTDELCEKLRSDSGRDFTNQAIRQITKAIAVSDRGRQAIFQHINGVVAYLTPALANEKRDAVKTSGENYYTKAGMSTEDKLWQQREKYLASVEEEAIRHVNPKNHFRAKLANALEHAKAYELLLAFVNAEMQDNRLKITLNRGVELSERELDAVLFQARAVFNNRNANGDGEYVEAVEYVVNATNSTFRELEKEQEPELPKGKWGKICAEFVAEYGMNMYKHWIAPLHVEEDDKIITLTTNSEMVKDRIMEKYWQRISYYSEIHNIDLNIKYSG